MGNSKADFIGVYEKAFPLSVCNGIIDYFKRSEELNLIATDARKKQQGQDRHLIDDSSCDLGVTHNIQNLSTISKELLPKFTEGLFKCWNDYCDTFTVLEPTSINSHVHSPWCKLQRSTIGQGYHQFHFENGGLGVCHRLATWILYLNKVEEGGETEFLYYPRRVKPEAGTLVIFPAGYTHTHRGNQPLSGVKFIATGWFELGRT